MDGEEDGSVEGATVGLSVMTLSLISRTSSSVSVMTAAYVTSISTPNSLKCNRIYCAIIAMKRSKNSVLLTGTSFLTTESVSVLSPLSCKRRSFSDLDTPVASYGAVPARASATAESSSSDNTSCGILNKGSISGQS